MEEIIRQLNNLRTRLENTGEWLTIQEETREVLSLDLEQPTNQLALEINFVKEKISKQERASFADPDLYNATYTHLQEQIRYLTNLLERTDWLDLTF